MGAVLQVLLACLGCAADDEIATVEDKVIANRLAIKRWHARISIHYPIGGSGDDPLAIESYVDGGRQREDSTWPYAKHERFAGLTEETYDDRRIYDFDQGQQTSYSTQLFPGRAVYALNVHRDVFEPNPEGKIQGCDIRWTAWHPEGILFSFPMTKILRNSRYVDRQMEDDMLHNVFCKKISFRRDEDRHTMWVAPEMGFSILEYDLESMGPGGARISRTEIAVNEWKESGIWLPVSTVYEKTVDETVELREQSTIEFFALNEPLDPSLFATTSLGVPVGRAVNIPPDSTNARWIWDGTKPVQVELPVVQAGESAEVLTSGGRWILLSSAFVLTLICVACFWRLFTAKKAT